jgi:hypothetical protein
MGRYSRPAWVPSQIGIGERLTLRSSGLLNLRCDVPISRLWLMLKSASV